MKVLAGFSPILYHITGSRRAVQILQKDRFELTPTEGTKIETDLVGAVYYLSTSRTLSGSYIQTNAYVGFTILVLDGRALAHHLKGAPVDYWGEEMRGDGSHFESEDRIFSPSPIIENAHKFILEVHSLIGGASYSAHGAILFQILLQTKRLGIPAFFYDSTSAFKTLNKKKSIKLDLKRLKPENLKITDYGVESLATWKALWTIPVGVYKRLKNLPRNEQELHGISSRFERLMSMVVSYPRDVEVFLADLHNAKSIPYGTNSKDRERLDDLVAIMRKNKLTPEKFYTALGNKWRGVRG